MSLILEQKLLEVPELNPTTPRGEAWWRWFHSQKGPNRGPQHMTLSVCDAEVVPLPESFVPSIPP